MGLNVLFSFGFSALFRTIGWLPHGGLALANSLVTALEVSVLFMIMSKRLNGINELQILRGGLQSTGGTLAMSIAVLLILAIFSGHSGWLLVLTGILTGGLVYALAMIIFHIPELGILFRIVQRVIFKLK